jgi:VWFA-related protein
MITVRHTRTRRVVASGFSRTNGGPPKGGHYGRHFAVSALVLALAAGSAGPSAQQQPPDQPRFESSTGVTIVSVDVVVRDSAGNVVRGLTAKDFIVSEDGKPQQISTFSFQEIAAAAPGSQANIQLLDGLEDKVRAEAAKAVSVSANTPETAATAAVPNVNNQRMWMIVLDVSSMQPDDVQRAVEDAREWVSEKMTTADLVALITIGTRINVLSDFTTSKEDVLAAIQALAYNEGTEVNPEAIATAASEAEAAASTETAATEVDIFQEFNNDVRLRLLKTLCQELAPIQQKKALLYFSAGMNRSGGDNQIELRSATSTCNRGNVSIYPIDTRGLQATAAGGGASSRGNGRSLLTGGGMGGFARINQSQETLNTLAADTGGRAFTATNDFGDAFDRVQNDLAAYYLLGYSSTNPARDGKFRSIQVRLVNRPETKGARIEARPGYYAGRSFANTNNRDREAMLDDQLQAAVSSTDMPMVLGTGYFRQQTSDRPNDRNNPDRFYVPIALAVPGFAVPVANKAAEVQLDVKGEVRDEQGRVIGRLRETIKVPSGGADTLAGKQVFYQSGVSLPPGRFIAKVVVRENTGGAFGSFEAPIIVPQMDPKVMKVSSVVMSTQVQKAATGRTDNPLVRDGVQLLPNLTRAVGRNQKVYFYYEVYDPALAEQRPDLKTSLAFYRAGVKVFETPVVDKTTIDEPNRRAVVFQFEVPAEQFKPGAYTCQINIIDSIASTVAFPRVSFVVME